MPRLKRNPSPKDLFQAYNEGFKGSLRNPNKLNQLMAELSMPIFGAASTYQAKNGKIVSLAGSGSNALALLHLAVRKFDKTLFEDEKQQTGDCTPGDNPVRMADGSIKRIADIQVGDMVITHKGRPQKVTRLIKKKRSKTGTICKVDFYKDHRQIEATPDHRILTHQRGEEVWVEAGKLQEGDLVLQDSPFVYAAKPYTYKESFAVVEAVYEKPFDDEVFCIDVEGDHSFFANGFAHHNCVSHGSRNGADTVRAVQIDINGKPEQWITRGATEIIYMSRGHNGQGMACSEAVEFLNKTGGVFLRKKYPELDLDLSTYDYKIGVKGRNGVPTSICVVGQEHQIKTVSLITSVEDACDAIANGYGVICCSNQGFSEVRDSEGFAKPKGNWSHCMAWVAVDTQYKRPGILDINSWAKWNSGPKRHDQPEGSFWIDLEVAEKMIKARGTWALSSFDGFPAQKLPDYSQLILG